MAERFQPVGLAWNSDLARLDPSAAGTDQIQTALQLSAVDQGYRSVQNVDRARRDQSKGQ